MNTTARPSRRISGASDGFRKLSMCGPPSQRWLTVQLLPRAVAEEAVAVWFLHDRCPGHARGLVREAATQGPDAVRAEARASRCAVPRLILGSTGAGSKEKEKPVACRQTWIPSPR